MAEEDGSSLYDILGVARDASTEDIRKAFRRKAKHLHPDAPGGDAEKFKRLEEATRILTDTDSRAQYDRTGDKAGKRLNDVRQEALSLLGHLIQGFANSNVPLTENPLDQMRKALGNGIQQLHGNRDKLFADKARTEKIRDRLKVRSRAKKRQPVNVFAEMLNVRIRNFDEVLPKIEFEIEKHQHALTILADYEFEEEVEVKSSAGGIFIGGPFRRIGWNT